jgi:hypothetical protein
VARHPVPALRHAKGSKERGEAAREIAGRRHMQPGGEWITFTERTIQRQLASIRGERQQHGGSRPPEAPRCGEARVILTKRWDAAVPFREVDKQVCADFIRDYVRGLIKAGETPTWVGTLAARKLAELTVAKGFDPGKEALDGLCKIPGNFIQAEAVFRKVHTFNTDREAYEDAKPRIRRTRAGLSPWTCSWGTLTPVDILVARSDGSIATPRMIAWLDLATNRIWADVVLLEKGEGIRIAHVSASYLAMVQSWGAPGRSTSTTGPSTISQSSSMTRGAQRSRLPALHRSGLPLGGARFPASSGRSPTTPPRSRSKASSRSWSATISARFPAGSAASG